MGEHDLIINMLNKQDLIFEDIHKLKNELHVNNLLLDEHMKRTRIMEERFELEKNFNVSARKELMDLIEITNTNLAVLTSNIKIAIKVAAACFSGVIVLATIIKLFM